MRRASLALLAMVVTLGPRVAGAQSHDDLARAEALFNAAKALTDAGQFRDACAKFAESKRLAPGLGVTLYLADCYEHIGRTASAWTEFLSAEGLARERRDPRADLAHARAQALEVSLGRLTIVVSPAVPRVGLEVLRDGVPVTQEEFGLAVPVDPGAHLVSISAPGHATRTVEAHVGPESATVNVERLDDAPAAEALPPPPAPPPAPAAATPEPAPAPAAAAPPPLSEPPHGHPGATRRWIGLGAGGLGVVGLGIGSALGLVAMSKRDQSNAGPCDATDHCFPPGLSLRQDAESAALGSTIAFIAGGVALATGAVLYLTAPRDEQGRPGVALAAVPLENGGGVMVRGGF